MTDKPVHFPERLALLSDHNAAQFITEGLLTGKENVSAIALGKVTDELPAHDVRWALQPVRDLVDDVMHAFRDDKPTKADAWLAPRLHATLRLTRREAAETGLWNHLALGVAPDFVVWRHPPTRKKDGKVPTVNAARFRGAHHTQAFARLWWAAELFRDGPDYAPVVVACEMQDMLNTVLRLDVFDHRPTAQALIRLLEHGTVRNGREVNALAAAVNASAATLMYDVIAPDVEPDDAALRLWVDTAGQDGPVPRRALPDGPDELPTPEDSVAKLTDYFAELFADVPVRGRTTEDDEA
ncbi:DUF6339 family protein [Streptomyces sp. NPDC017941]|uniref:DUF6339 family protein n=1 Tax=Streptomyces sp. NPDC017941 TaxID=3365018 RepID=UPI0037A9F60A